MKNTLKVLVGFPISLDDFLKNGNSVYFLLIQVHNNNSCYLFEHRPHDIDYPFSETFFTTLDEALDLCEDMYNMKRNKWDEIS
jgi:hypothetical protein